MKIIAKEDRCWCLYKDDNGEYYLSSLCGTVGMFESVMELNESEAASYESDGTTFIKSLAEKVRNDPEGFMSRHIKGFKP